MILIPPAVDPAIPPRNIKTKSINCEKTGHCSKSAVTNPVVVMMETTWNDA